MVNAFFGDSTPEAERAAMLSNYGVDYVIYSPQEAGLGDYDPNAAPFLAKVYEDGDTQVYQVDTDMVTALSG